MKKVLLGFFFLITVLVIAIPVSATPPEDIVINLTSHYSFFDFGNPTGTWDSSGLITSSGELYEELVHEGAGWPHGIGFKNARSVQVISDEYGTITLSMQITGVEWTYFDNDACIDNPSWLNSDQKFEGIGSWVILSGTGAYEDIRGQGALTMVDGEVSCENFTMDVVTDFEGTAHFDPN